MSSTTNNVSVFQSSNIIITNGSIDLHVISNNVKISQSHLFIVFINRIVITYGSVIYTTKNVSTCKKKYFQCHGFIFRFAINTKMISTQNKCRRFFVKHLLLILGRDILIL